MSDANDPSRNLPLSHPLRSGTKTSTEIKCQCGAREVIQATPEFRKEVLRRKWTHSADGATYRCPACS